MTRYRQKNELYYNYNCKITLSKFKFTLENVISKMSYAINQELKTAVIDVI